MIIFMAQIIIIIIIFNVIIKINYMIFFYGNNILDLNTYIPNLILDLDAIISISMLYLDVSAPTSNTLMQEFLFTFYNILYI
jgi:hypothetical protein